MTREEAEKRVAHALLDRVRLGEDMPERRVNWALRILGDLVGYRPYTDDGEPILILERRAA